MTLGCGATAGLSAPVGAAGRAFISSLTAAVSSASPPSGVGGGEAVAMVSGAAAASSSECALGADGAGSAAVTAVAGRVVKPTRDWVLGSAKMVLCECCVQAQEEAAAAGMT